MNFTLSYLLQPFEPFRLDKLVTDIVVNKPYEIGVERDGKWSWHDAPTLSYNRLYAIAKLCAYETSQDVSAIEPLCDTTLPTGERLKICLPPVVKDTITLAIRVPSRIPPTLDYLESKGMFELFPALPDVLHAAVLDRKNILIAGPVGAGKTTLGNALIDVIPDWERLLAIEDTPEFVIKRQNCVRLSYSKGEQSTAKITIEDLMATSLRMRPDRVLMQELRDKSAWVYLRNVVAGHPGSITTLHANSAEGAFDSIRLMVRESTAGASLADSDIRALINDLVDIAIYCRQDATGQRRVTDIYPKGLV